MGEVVKSYGERERVLFHKILKIIFVHLFLEKIFNYLYFLYIPLSKSKSISINLTNINLVIIRKKLLKWLYHDIFLNI